MALMLLTNVFGITTAHGFRRPQGRVCDPVGGPDPGLARVRSQGRQRRHLQELPVQGGPHEDRRRHGTL